MADRKIYFATDIHGSEVCLRKFLNAAKFYDCDTLIMGGDITGKMIVPIVDRGQGVHTATLYGRNLQVSGDGLAKLRKTIADAGYYAYETTPEEMDRFHADPGAVTELFGKLMHETLGRWLELAEERLAGVGIRNALWIGASQILALFAGISREGVTMVGGLLRGLDHEDADEAEIMEAKERDLLARHHRTEGGPPT